MEGRMRGGGAHCLLCERINANKLLSLLPVQIMLLLGDFFLTKVARVEE